MALSLKFRRRSMEKNWQASGQESLQDEVELSKGTKDLFELLEKLQNNRLDDQRCVLPSTLQLPQVLRDDISSLSDQEPSETINKDNELLQKVLSRDGPYPTVVLPPSGGYRLETGDETVPDFNDKGKNENCLGPTIAGHNSSNVLEIDEIALLYRRHFYNKDHYNFIMNDQNIGPIVMSVKNENINSKEFLRVILRRKHSILSELIPLNVDIEPLQALKVAKIVCDDITTDKFFAVLFPKAPDLIRAFDEHVLINKLKFGVIYQKHGQTTEEEMFGNETHSAAMEEFLQFLGEKIPLKGFTGFRGGLDTQDGLTGDHAFYTVFEGVEIMFHVSTLLPYSRTDPQQLQRKRHIGNDVVAIIFQDDNTPFMPSVIASHFLHTFIVVQVIEPLTENTRYKVSVVCREDVPYFGPSIPKPSIFKKTNEFRQFFLTKLINAELASLKAKKFASLERRTRDSLLQALHENLLERTMDFCGFSIPNDSNKSDSGSSSGFFDSVRKALSGRHRSHSVESNLAHTTPKRSSSRASNSSLTGTLTGETTPSTLRGHSSQILDSSLSQTPLNGDMPKENIDSNNINSQVQLLRRAGSDAESNASTPPPLQNTLCESDSSSMNSFELERHATREDSDTGMESMSSTDATISANVQPVSAHSINDADKANNVAENMIEDDLKDAILELKHDKLYWLKEIWAYQNEVKRLKENEIKLAAELSLARQDIRRLTSILASYQIHSKDSLV